jgi:hypothetical protein
MYSKFESECLGVREHLRDVGTDSRKFLQWMLMKENMRLWTDFIWLEVRISGMPIVETVMNFQIRVA